MARELNFDAGRTLDVVLAAVGLVVLAPVALVIALAVACTSRGPVIHRARRVGVGGEPFTLYKFRSMTHDADASGPAVTASGDRRITRVGHVLRRSKLDEIPQLVNVVLGDMAIVGPRPEDPRYVEMYTPAERRILRFRPGITSPASVAYRNEEGLLASGGDLEQQYQVVMREKLRLDLDYFERRTIRSDLGWMVRTVAAVFSGSGVER